MCAAEEEKLARLPQNHYYISMKIVEVIPFSRGIQKETLTYFSSLEIPLGAIVKVPLRNKDINALVVAVHDAEELRIDVKNSTFAFKKVSSIVSTDLFSKPFIAAAEKAAAWHASSLGSMFNFLVPKIILECGEEIKSPPAPTKNPERLHGQILQADDEDRFSHYRSLVREEFARNRSVFLCVPTYSDIKRAEKLMEKGIGEYSFVFHAAMKKKEFIKKWADIQSEKHPILIICTPQFLSLPRYDIGSIIVERESSKSYKGIFRPYADMRKFIEYFSREINARLVYGDIMLRTETMWRYRNDELGEVTPPSLRLQTTADQHLVDTRKTLKSSTKFEPISPALTELIKLTKENSEHLVIFSSRRGLSPLTICADCSTIVSCHRCKAPVTLHSRGDDRFFLCHRCGEQRDANEKCENCSSWRLQTLGIGTELLAEEVQSIFPNFNIFRLDADTAKTHKQAMEIVEKFYETPGSVLIGTEMALLYLDQKVANVAVASIDSLFALPDFRIREKVLNILVKLRYLAQKNFVIQTRNPAEPVFDFALKGNLLDFYKQEIAERESFDYPPLTVLIKVSLSGPKEKVENVLASLQKKLEEYNTNVYPAFAPWKQGVYTMHLLIKIGRNRWIEKNLQEKLKSLPPAFSVAVDPESIL